MGGRMVNAQPMGYRGVGGWGPHCMYMCCCISIMIALLLWVVGSMVLWLGLF